MYGSSAIFIGSPRAAPSGESRRTPAALAVERRLCDVLDRLPLPGGDRLDAGLDHLRRRVALPRARPDGHAALEPGDPGLELRRVRVAEAYPPARRDRVDLDAGRGRRS